MQSIEARLEALEASAYAGDTTSTVENITLSVVRFVDAHGIGRQLAFGETVEVYGTTAGMTSLASRGFITIT